MAFEAEGSASSCCLSGVVGLDRAEGDDDIGVLVTRGAEQELQLARLVAPGAETRAVVTLDPDSWPAECFR